MNNAGIPDDAYAQMATDARLRQLEDDRAFGQPHRGHPPEDLAPQDMRGDMPAADNPDAGDFFIEPAEEHAPEGDRLERLEALVSQLKDAQWEVANIETKLENALKLERELRENHIPELMKEVNMKTLTLSDGVELTVEDDFKCGISETSKPLAFKWLRDQKLGGIIKRMIGVAFGKGEDDKAKELRDELTKQGFIVDDDEGVHWQTLHATLKEEREKGTAIPADLFGLFEYQTTKLKPPRGMRLAPKPKFKKKSS